MDSVTSNSTTLTVLGTHSEREVLSSREGALTLMLLKIRKRTEETSVATDNSEVLHEATQEAAQEEALTTEVPTLF